MKQEILITGKGASEIFGISMVFHESKNNIDKELSNLNYALKQSGFENQMVHTTVLIYNKKNQYKKNTFERKKIINILFHFHSVANIKSKSFFINKNEIKNKEKLINKLVKLIEEFIINHYDYLLSFENVLVYYDDGQLPIRKAIRKGFKNISSFDQIKNFDKTNEKLFQVADMITYFDKYLFKIENKIPLTNVEKKFYYLKEMKYKIKIIRNKTFK